MNRDKARGALAGLAIGDALGTTHEFLRIKAPAFPTLATGPLREIVGGGPFHLEPGQVTDDTQMACCLASSLRERRGFDAADVARRYVEWVRTAFDVGGTTAAALGRIEQGTEPLEAGLFVWMRSGRDNAAGNGSLMRTAPIGVFFAESAQERRRASLDDSAVTHFDPRCRIACAAFNSAIAAAIVPADPVAPGDLLSAARDEVKRASDTLRDESPDLRDPVGEAREDLLGDLDAAERPDPALYGPDLHLTERAGFVRVAFRLAFWELLHAPTFEAALTDVVNRGGDADTNGAVAGALLGACRGLGAIPKRWIEPVFGVIPTGEKALFSRDPPKYPYHPARLLEMLEI